MSLLATSNSELNSSFNIRHQKTTVLFCCCSSLCLKRKLHLVPKVVVPSASSAVCAFCLHGICTEVLSQLSNSMNEKCRKAGLLQQEAGEQQQEVKRLLLISSKLSAATNSLFPPHYHHRVFRRHEGKSSCFSARNCSHFDEINELDCKIKRHVFKK